MSKRSRVPGTYKPPPENDERGDECIFCFAIAWLHDHDHGREYEPLVENLTDAIDRNGYEIWKALEATFDPLLRQFAIDHRGSANQRHIAIATAAIERSWERGQSGA
jgi:hypothetical protein